MESQVAWTDARVNDEAIWHVELPQTDYGYRADHIGVGLLAKTRVGPSLV